MMSSDSVVAFEFGPFRLDPRNRQLVRGGTVVPLSPKVFDVLVTLVEHRGCLMRKDELLGAVWPDTFVTEANLTQAVFILRKALGETGSVPGYITTIPGQGYRFTGDVTVITESSEPTPAQDGPAEVERRSRGWGYLLPVAGLTVVTVVVAGIVSGAFRPAGQEPQANTRFMLAVLPFTNLTGNPDQEYFTDGFTEEVIAQIGALDPDRLGVIARSSVMAYKTRVPPLDRIRRELGVQYVLEGSVRRDAQTVRITAQLVRADDRSHVWSRQYDRELERILALQGEIARDIAAEISRRLAPRQERHSAAADEQLSPSRYEAYDAYLKGRYFCNKRTAEGLTQAIDHFQDAIAIDPAYARAHAGLADSYTLMSLYGLGPAIDLLPKARSAALRALDQDDSLAEAHTSLALISLNYDRDWRAAEREYLRAIHADPNYATAHHWYAEFLAFQGRFDEAFRSIERARELDPLSLIIAADYGAILYFAREYDRAIRQLRQVLDAAPGFPRARIIIYAYAEKGMFAEALAAIRNWRKSADTPLDWGLEAFVRGRQGRLAESRQALARAEAASTGGGVDLASLRAVAYAGMNDIEKAIAALQQAFREHSSLMVTLKVEPMFDPLRVDPRFQELLRLTGLDVVK